MEVHCVERRCRKFILAASAALAVLIGCSKGPETLDISGTVTYKGQPLKHYQVTFFPEHGRPSMGLTDDSGHYKLVFTAGQGGALRGKNKVTVDYVPPDDAAARKAEMGQIPDEAKAIRAKYGDMKTTPLQFEVTKAEVKDWKLD